MTRLPATAAGLHGWREHVAWALWHAHPARPGPLYAALRESQWWPRERIEEEQVRKLRRLVQLAAAVPHYRERLSEAGVGHGDLRSVSDIARLPILEREDAQRLGVEGLRVPGTRGMRASTSGSTGRKVRFLWPLEQMRWLDAGEARARAWMGSDVGTRRLEVRCRAVGRAQAVSAVLLNTAAFHAPVVSDPAAVRRLVRELERRPPALIWGVSNALYALAVALLDDDRTVRTGACWSGGNHLHAHYRRAFERAFECEVYERYATMETGLVAHECVEARSLHVPGEGLVVEVVRGDGSAAAPGEIGDVLLTTLHNTATPLIRYRVGDRAVAAADAPCACGRGLPVFGRVVGRHSDCLVTADGALVTPAQAVAAVAPGTNSIVDFQVVQDRDGRLRISVVQRDADSAAQDRRMITEVFDRLVRPSVTPVIERVSHIPLTPGGKLRTLVTTREHASLPAAIVQSDGNPGT
jgi:phenylacetate-CoA ligase